MPLCSVTSVKLRWEGAHHGFAARMVQSADIIRKPPAQANAGFRHKTNTRCPPRPQTMLPLWVRVFTDTMIITTQIELYLTFNTFTDTVKFILSRLPLANTTLSLSCVAAGGGFRNPVAHTTPQNGVSVRTDNMSRYCTGWLAVVQSYPGGPTYCNN